MAAKSSSKSSSDDVLDISKDSTPVSELEWIALLKEMESTSPPPENQLKKMKRKVMEEPLVPIGALVTASCLGFGLVAMKNGDSKRQQFFMRGRILAQGFTIVVITAGVVYKLWENQGASSAKTGTK